MDSAATDMCTWSRQRCFNVVPCDIEVTVTGADGCSNTLYCKEKGDTFVTTYDQVTGITSRVLLTGVLINPLFPFHIFSEILAFDLGMTASKSKNSWTFYNSNSAFFLRASQHLLDRSDTGNADASLYFIDDSSYVQSPARACGFGQMPVPIAARFCALTSNASKTIRESPRRVAPEVAIVKTTNNLAMLLELHCAHAHWNLEAVAKQYGLSLPNPPPKCWACMLSKPRKITQDTVSTRHRTKRPYEGLAADAKGPINRPTPEGHKYFFLIIDLFSSYC